MTGRPTGGRAPKRRRLSRSAEFERVYRQGRSKANRFLVLYAFPRDASEPPPEPAEGPRLGLSVSRRVGGAVDRTKVKRVLREAFWAEAERLPEGADYVIVARPDARELAEREGMPGDPHRARRARGRAGRRAGARAVSAAAPASSVPRAGRLRRAAIAPIRLYQRVISPALPRRCKYHPTCSAYAVQAIESFGILRGVVLAAWRLLRCNPFSHGGYDPVDAQTLFARAPRPTDPTGT